MGKPKDYNYILYEGHGCGKVMDRGTFYDVQSMDELRRRAISKMSKTEKQTLEISTAKYPDYSETAIEIYNHYFGSVSSDMGEVWTKNGMRAFDKITGKLGGKTGY